MRLVVEQARDGDDVPIVIERRKPAIREGAMLGEERGFGKPFRHAVVDPDILSALHRRARRDGNGTTTGIGDDVAIDIDAQEVELVAADFRQTYDAHIQKLADHAGDALEHLERIARERHAQLVKRLQAPYALGGSRVPSRLLRKFFRHGPPIRPPPAASASTAFPATGARALSGSPAPEPVAMLPRLQKYR